MKKDLTLEQKSIIRLASRFEKEMKEKGFTIGKMRISPEERWQYFFDGKGGWYPVFIGFRLNLKGDAYIHNLGLRLRYPVAHMDFLYLENKEMKKLCGNKKGILVTLDEIDEIDLGVSNPGFERVKEACSLCNEIESWIERNGERLKHSFRHSSCLYVIHSE